MGDSTLYDRQRYGFGASVRSTVRATVIDGPEVRL